MALTLDYSHTGFQSLSRASIADVLRSELGLRIRRLYPINTGHVNRCFWSDAGGRRIFCKVSPLWYRGSLSREKWCLEKLRLAGLAVPKVIGLISESNRQVPGHAFLVLEYIEGKTLGELPVISRDIWKEIAAIYRVIHGFPVRGYGWLDGNFTGKHSSWRDFLIGIENLDYCRSFAPGLAEAIDRLLSSFQAEDFDLGPGCLLYGDFNLDNFLLSPSGQIYALDFQNCFSGDPLYDYPLAIDRYPRFIDLLGPLDYCQKRRLGLYALRYLLTRISYFLQHDRTIATYYLGRFQNVFAKYYGQTINL